MNLRLAFVSSSSAECDHLQHAGLEVHVKEVLVPLEADQQRVAGVGLAGQGARRPPVVEHRDDPLHLDSGHVGMYRVSGLSCPEAGGCKSAILRGFPDVFRFFGP